jgi:hypothetical protein
MAPDRCCVPEPVCPSLLGPLPGRQVSCTMISHQCASFPLALTLPFVICAIAHAAVDTRCVLPQSLTWGLLASGTAQQDWTDQSVFSDGERDQGQAGHGCMGSRVRRASSRGFRIGRMISRGGDLLIYEFATLSWCFKRYGRSVHFYF